MKNIQCIIHNMFILSRKQYFSYFLEVRTYINRHEYGNLKIKLNIFLVHT